MSETENGTTVNLNFELPSKEQTIQIMKDWTKYWNEHKGEILERSELEKRLLEKSDPNRIFESQVVPGIYEFDSPQVLYVVYSSFFGQEKALEAVSHELEHYEVHKKYGIRCGFGIALSKQEGNLLFGVGLLIPHYPDDFDDDKKKAIMNESNLAVKHPSLRDIEAVKKFSPPEKK